MLSEKADKEGAAGAAPWGGGVLESAYSDHEQFRKCREACKQSSVNEPRSRESAVVWKEKSEADLMN